MTAKKTAKESKKDEVLVRFKLLPKRLPNLVDKYPVVFYVVVAVSALAGFILGKIL